MRCRVHLAALLLLLFLLSSRVAAAAAGAGGAPDAAPPGRPQPCLDELLPCTAYLKTAKHPSNTCCTAMHHAAAAEMPCLCRLLADPELLATFNVTREQMFRLPARCGLPVGCRAGAHEPVVEAPPPPAPTPPHHQGDSSGGDGLRDCVWRLIASVVLGGMFSVAALS
ncbi:non-specific lipid transfer protein GPI-anchored 7-like [Phragmites australis]|uniref:non-specific lipid transfer protein GPI-anchored 7-like n=1 Tax=Phragmites australis TaxID=29695 RepID=UPI002D7818E7|nr:non-specific lipid transfer protein GPI-anchored 7-like [Phragmites australis]